MSALPFGDSRPSSGKRPFYTVNGACGARTLDSAAYVMALSADITVRVAPDRAICEHDTQCFEFPSKKRLKTQDWPIPKKTRDIPGHPRRQGHREILVDLRKCIG